MQWLIPSGASGVRCDLTFTLVVWTAVVTPAIQPNPFSVPYCTTKKTILQPQTIKEINNASIHSSETGRLVLLWELKWSDACFLKCLIFLHVHIVVYFNVCVKLLSQFTRLQTRAKKARRQVISTAQLYQMSLQLMTILKPLKRSDFSVMSFCQGLKYAIFTLM